MSTEKYFSSTMIFGQLQSVYQTRTRVIVLYSRKKNKNLTKSGNKHATSTTQTRPTATLPPNSQSLKDNLTPSSDVFLFFI